MSFSDRYHGGPDTLLTFRRDTLKTLEDFFQELDNFAEDCMFPEAKDLLERIKQQATPDNYQTLCDMIDFLEATTGINPDEGQQPAKDQLDKYNEHARFMKRLTKTEPDDVKKIVEFFEHDIELLNLPTNKRPHRRLLLENLKDVSPTVGKHLPGKAALEEQLDVALEYLEAKHGFKLPEKSQSNLEFVINVKQ